MVGEDGEHCRIVGDGGAVVTVRVFFSFWSESCVLPEVAFVIVQRSIGNTIGLSETVQTCE